MTHPDQSEQQLRRALHTMNDLEPPTDELFVQRAVIRGRARTHRRRNALVGVAAALVVVAGGGTWLLQDGLPQTSSSTAAGEAEDLSASDSGGVAGRDSSGGLPTPAAAPDLPPAASARGAEDWFVGPLTPQRAAIEALSPDLTTRWGAVFSGAYATDPTNSSLVVALTYPEPTLEALVRSAMPDPSDVQFVAAEHSYSDKAALAKRIRADSAALEREGIVITSVTQDHRADRVAVAVVAAVGAEVQASLTERYGADWITVTLLERSPGGTTPTPER